MKVRWRRILVLLLPLVWLAVAFWHTHKPLPQGTHVASAVCPVPAARIGFIADITAADAYGRQVVSQGIFDEVLRAIAGAHQFIVLDYSLIAAADPPAAPQRHLAAELTDALLAKRQAEPGLRVLFITDPANERYGAQQSPQLQLLRAAGVEVVLARLDKLRDPNFLYSSLWRLGLRWWDRPRGPLGFETRRLNFKSDHRKVVIADDGDALVAVVGSANPEDRQSGWSNLAARVSGDAVGSLLESELAIARFSGWSGDSEPYLRAADPQAPDQCSRAGPAATLPAPLTQDSVRVQVLTEGATRSVLLERISLAGHGDAIDIAAFAIADRSVIEALLDAARRGAAIRLILDPSEDATTLAPSGLPNQPTASELVSRSGGAIRVRWYRTHGERFHGTMVIVPTPHQLWLTLGSANLTRRSLDDYNLEANLGLEVLPDSALAQQVQAYFDTLWSNRAALGIEYTADFAVFADSKQEDYWLSRLLEGAGFTGF